jgi:AcrR family transcriptional regulator
MKKQRIIATRSRKPQNSRQAQAEETRMRIFFAARELLRKQEYERITIKDIVSHARVSVGTFYLYFRTKEEIFFEMHQESDKFFVSELFPSLFGKTTEDKILSFFEFYAQLFLRQGGLPMVKVMFSPNNKCLLRDAPGSIPRMLRDIFMEGMRRGVLLDDIAPEKAASFFLIAVRGLLFNWGACDGEYDLVVTMNAFVRKLLKGFLVSGSDRRELPEPAC